MYQREDLIKVTQGLKSVFSVSDKIFAQTSSDSKKSFAVRWKESIKELGPIKDVPGMFETSKHQAHRAVTRNLVSSHFS